MKVLVNLTWLVPGQVGGSEESTTDAIRALLAHEPDAELTLAVLTGFSRAHPDLAAACPCEVLDHSGTNKAARVAAEQTWLVRRSTELAPDVVHHAGGVMPLRHPGRTVLTIHDLQPLDMPENFSFAKRTYIRTMIGRSARAADVVAVPSRFTASRVSSRLRVPRNRLAVVPWSVVSLDRTADSDSGGSAPQAAPHVAGPVFLYPAITYPHKNHLMLLEAFAQFRRVAPSARLVLAGGEGPCEQQVMARIARPDLSGSVQRPGRVPRKEMDRLYRSSTAVMVPSRYEGFGLPALEAMSRGVPLVVADSGSLPEVVHAEGPDGATAESARVLPLAALDPDDPGAWCEAMEVTAALTAEQRDSVASAERSAASRFSPQRTAAALMDAYRRAASADRSGR